MATTRERSAASDTTTRDRNPVFSALAGLASLGVLLQALWAGLFVHEGEEYTDTWVNVHDIGAQITFGLSVLAFIASVIWLRHRPSVVVGAGIFAALIFLESYIGGEIGNSSWLTAIHFPLAMGLMGLAVWLPLRALRPRARA